MGAVIGPSKSQYLILQGKTAPKASSASMVQSGRETFGKQDVYLLPAIKNKSGLQNAKFYWSMDMGKVDPSDIFLIDSQIDATKIFQFADCIWYEPPFKGSPLMDTRGSQKWGNYRFGADLKSFEIAYYNHDTPVPGIQPHQFKRINFSKINLDKINQTSSQKFLETYQRDITNLPFVKYPKPGSTQMPGKDPVTGLAKGRWYQDIIGDSTVNPPKPGGGVLWLDNQKQADSLVRFEGLKIYLDLDRNAALGSRDRQIGSINVTVPTTGRSGSFKQVALGGRDYAFFADALDGAQAGLATLTVPSWPS